MSNAIQSISSLAPGAARISGAAGVREAPEVQRPGEEDPAPSPKPLMDEYIPEEKQEPSGRYWLGRDEDGRPKVCFDGPEGAADQSGRPEESSGAPARDSGAGSPGGDGGRKAERCTGSTDRVDREIEGLRRKREELRRQISAEPDGVKAKALEQKLAQVERELSQKDNDAYRRQHTVFS